MPNKKQTWGGARKGSGAKPKYNEKTKLISFRCPMSMADEIKTIVKNELLKYQKP